MALHVCFPSCSAAFVARVHLFRTVAAFSYDCRYLGSLYAGGLWQYVFVAIAFLLYFILYFLAAGDCGFAKG